MLKTKILASWLLVLCAFAFPGNESGHGGDAGGIAQNAHVLNLNDSRHLHSLLGTAGIPPQGAIRDGGQVKCWETVTNTIRCHFLIYSLHGGFIAEELFEILVLAGARRTTDVHTQTTTIVSPSVYCENEDSCSIQR